MRFTALDVIKIVGSAFLSLMGLFIAFVCFDIRELIGKPDGIPAIITFLLFLFPINLLPNYSLIEASVFLERQ